VLLRGLALFLLAGLATVAVSVWALDRFHYGDVPVAVTRGLVWIALSKDHYGLHGTPEPSTIGRAQSHGCVRLTNWDALKVAALVQPGTKVVFTE